MKLLRLLAVILLVVSLTACSKKNKKPPLLSDTAMPSENLEDTGLGSSGGPYVSSGSGLDQGSSTASPGGSWSESTGDMPLSRSGYTGEWSSDPNLSTIYFDYNSFELSSQAQATLDRDIGYLREKPSLRVLLEGNCDERGTEEYNQALGERRALSAREYLINQGISASRIDVISYGELRPAVEGNSESAWGKNRRVEFKVAG